MRRRVVLTSSAGLLAGLTGRIAVPEPTTVDSENRTRSDRNRTTAKEPTRDRSEPSCDDEMNRIVERTFVPNSRDAYGYFATTRNTTDRNGSDSDGSNTGSVAIEFVPSKKRVLVYGLTFATQCPGGLKLRSATYDADSDTISITIASETTPSSPTTRSGPQCIPNQGETAYEATITFTSYLPSTVIVSSPTGTSRFTRRLD